MKVLFIGGTGTISTEITKQLQANENFELFLLNRGNRNNFLNDKVQIINVDVYDEQAVREKIKDLNFDIVCDFIAFTPDALERDYRLFKDKTQQFIFISSASAYQKPLSNYIITESTPLSNPYAQYSRNKIDCEEYLIKMYRENNFPITIIRPTHTYDNRSIPSGVHGNKGSYQVLKRIMENKPVIIHGDGSSLWTLTHCSDFAKGFIGLLGNSSAIGETYHITSDEALTWNAIYNQIAKILGKELKVCYVPSDILCCAKEYDYTSQILGDKSNTVIFDNSKIKKTVPTFCATTRFNEGARKTIEYILAHKECQVEDKEFDRWCDKVIKIMNHAKEEISK